MTAWWVTGSTLDVLRKIPDGSVDLVLSSPPFFALRSYLDPDDPNKVDEIGSEATPGEFIDTLLDVTEECLRLLAPHGTLAFELGDTYGGSGGAGGDYNADGLREGQSKFDGSSSRKRSVPKSMSAVATADAAPPARLRTRRELPGFPLDKSLCLIPELYRMALAYGFNPLTGRECTRWRVRNVVRWVRPNPPVGALGDKFRPATSEMVVACQSRTRYFDLDAVRTPSPRTDNSQTTSTQYQAPGQPERKTRASDENGARIHANEAGAPPLDWWEIPTAPYKGSHYATWPPALCERPIKAMSPEKVCTTCGEPSRRITSEPEYVRPDGSVVDVTTSGAHENNDFSTPNRHAVTGVDNGNFARRVETIGWSTCGHDTWRPGRILDPFAGSGTTLAVATGHGRDAVGIDLDHRNVDLARQRVGMFLNEVTVDELAGLLAAAEDT